MNNKINLVLTALIISFCVSKLTAQDLILEYNSIYLSDNSTDKSITIKIKNNSHDTVFISLDPINSDVVDSYEYRLFHTFGFSFQPARIIFYKNPSTGFFSYLSKTNISYMKFPQILSIAPTSNSVIIINIGDSIINQLRGFEWSINPIICYAFKKEIFSALSTKANFLQIEFINSLIEKDTIYLDLMYNFQKIEKVRTKYNVIRETVKETVQISEPKLYRYKNCSDSIDSLYFCSMYDSIIYLFHNTLR